MNSPCILFITLTHGLSHFVIHSITGVHAIFPDGDEDEQTANLCVRSSYPSETG